MCRYNARMGITLIGYGIVVAVMGVLGFRMAGSRQSLIMGVFTGLMLVMSGGLVLMGNRGGAYYGLGVNAALILVFAAVNLLLVSQAATRADSSAPKPHVS